MILGIFEECKTFRTNFRWTTLVIADVVGLYPSIPYKAVLETLRRRLNEREMFEMPTENIVQMAEFILKNNIFEFNGEFKR